MGRREDKRTIMKTLLFVAAFLAMALAAPQVEQPSESGPNANAAANADPWYGYYGYGRPYGYGGYGWGGYYGRGYYGGYYRPHGYYGYYGKRSADEAPESGPNANADPTADPWYSYYGGYGYGAYRPYGYGYH